MSDFVRPHRRQPTRLPHPWDSPGKNTGVGCHVLLQCMKVKSESEVVQSCPTLSDPMDCSPPGSSVHGIFQATVLEWGAIGLLSRGSGEESFSKFLYIVGKIQFLVVMGLRSSFLFCQGHSLLLKALRFPSFIAPPSSNQPHCISIFYTLKLIDYSGSLMVPSIFRVMCSSSMKNAP